MKSALHDLFAIKEESVSVAKGFISLRDLEEFGQRKREVSSLDGAESMPFHVGVLANMDFRKGIDRFLCILSELPARIGASQVKWTWWERGRVLRKARSPKLFRKGIVHWSDLHPWKHISGVDLLFSFAREDPFPLVNLEALARKIPVAGIRGSGGIDELEEEGYAVTCPFETSAIIKTLKGFMEERISFPKSLFSGRPNRGRPRSLKSPTALWTEAFLPGFSLEDPVSTFPR